MNAIIAALALLALQSARPLLVLVPEAADPETCFAAERVAAVMSLTKGVRLLRAQIEPGETLETARTRTGADLAIIGTRRPKNGGEEVTLELARAGKSSPERSTSSGPPVDRVESALLSLWPKDAPPLALVASAGSASAPALEAICKNDIEAAYALSGAAVAPAMRERLAPPPSDPKGILLRLAKATALRRAGKNKDAIPILKGVIASFQKHESAPIWRRDPNHADPPTALDLIGDRLILFRNGAFVRVDLATGAELWTAHLGKADPHLTDAGDDLAIAALEHEIAALDLKDGSVRWRVPLESPMPEIARLGTRIFAAGTAELVALERQRGEVAWRLDPLADIVSGPRLIDETLVIAGDTVVLAIDPATGVEKRRTDVGDEISAPLAISERGLVWALVGGDQVQLVDSKRGEVKLRATDLPGVEWPVAPLHDGLVIAFARSRARRFLAYLDPAVKKGVKRLYPGGLPPVVLIPGTDTILHTQDRPSAILLRDKNGNVLWRSAYQKKIHSLSTAREGDIVIAGVGSRVLGLEPKKGAALFDVELAPSGPERPPPKKAPQPPPTLVKAVVFESRGGAALLDNGVVYGLPSRSDPRPKEWLRSALLELARASAGLNQTPAAVSAAKDMLKSDPDDLDALAILAQAEEKANPKQAAERWRKVAMLSPRRDPLQARAANALRTLAGIEAKIELERPIDLAVGGGRDEVVIVRTDESIDAVATKAPFDKLWSRPRAEVAALGNGHLRIGEEIVAASDGKVVRKLDPAGLFAGNGVLLRLGARGNGEEIAREDAAGKELWRTQIASGEAPHRVIDASDRYALVADKSEEGAVEVLKTASGERASAFNAGAKITLGSISEGVALLELPKKIAGADAESGKVVFALPIAEGDVLGIQPIEKGWLLLTKKSLKVLDRRGRVTVQIALPSPAERWAIAKSGPSETAFLALGDETLEAIDLGRGQVKGRLRLGRFVDLEPFGARLLATDAGGAVLVLDGSKALRP